MRPFMSGEVIFGIEPVIYKQARYVQQYDFVLVSDGRVMPTLDLVQEPPIYDPDDTDYMLIKLMSQRTLRIPETCGVLIARKGTNTNQV